MGDGHRSEGRATGEYSCRGDGLEHDLRVEAHSEKCHRQASSKLERQQQRVERRVDARQTAISLNIGSEQQDCDRNYENAGEQRRVERAGVLPRAGDADHQEDPGVPRELLKSEMREVTRDDAPQSAAALELERRARNQRGG